MVYMALGLDGFYLSQRGKQVHWEQLPRAHTQGFKIGLKGMGASSKPARDKVWDGTARLEG